MAVQSVALTEAESYLVALIQDPAAIDLAEFLWQDPMAMNEEKIFRAWDFQVSWWRDTATLLIDQCARAVGKTQSIILRGWAFPVQHPGAEMVVTAPELVHLDPLTSRIEDRIKDIRLTREMLPRGVGRGFKHRPFQVNFTNGAKILGRIPQRDGKGVKGLHPLRLEMDEAQDYPAPGWTELVETLRHGEKGAQWRSHGVAKGVRDEFYRHSQPGSGWSVHRITGMHRPTWSDVERTDKIEMYGTRDSPDYKRNILGVHGDATNPLFVLHRLAACTDDNLDSEYNTDIYYYCRINDEMIINDILDLVIIPGSHKQWKATWGGMDVGMTNHPSEILIFGEETVRGKPDPAVRLLSRIHLERIRSADQRRVVEFMFQEYQLQQFTLDRTGLGLPLFQELQDGAPALMERIVGYNADQKVVVGWDDHEDWEDSENYEIKRVAKEFGYDLLRQYVDQKRLILPWDRELLGEWQGQTWTRERSETNAYGKKSFARGQFHTLDAAAMFILGKELYALQALEKMRNQHEEVGIVFV